MRKFFLSSSLLLISSLLFAQKSGSIRKFGKVTPEELQKNVYVVDSNANAVVIYDFGKSEIVGNNKGWFSLEFTHHKIIHILKKGGYEMGDVEVPLYTDGSAEEKLISVKATTYNFENNVVAETRLEKSAIFSDKLDKHYIVKKFTLPGIKEGSIIEFEYKTTSDFIQNLQPWVFQGTAPRLWSEYQLTVPEFLGYVFISQGYHSFHINEKKDSRGQFSVSASGGTGPSEVTSIASNVTDHRWVMKDVPELKEESFTSTLKNHVSKIEFQLSEFRYPLNPRQIMKTWVQTSADLMADEDFGKSVAMVNGWLSDDIKPLLINTTTQIDKAKKIFSYVRDNFVCLDHNAVYIKQTLKNVLKTKKGNVSELNLLLTAMLRHEGIAASPILLSTRDHGFAYQLYPIMNRFNYVISHVTIDGASFYLDASHPRLGFGKMSYDCYNGWARIINETSAALDLSADSLNEQKVTTLILIDDNGKWAGNFTNHPGYFESYNLRNKIKDEGQDAVFKTIKKNYGDDVKTEYANIDSLDNYEAPLALQYRFTTSTPSDDIIYLNPMFGEAQKENPFKAAERLYPVEMPYTMDETYIATIYVPKGYEVEEMPKQIMVKLNEENEGLFEYAIQNSGGIISLRSRVKLSRANYSPEEYELLREFFNLVVKKHSEQIVFKKKK